MPEPLRVGILDDGEHDATGSVFRRMEADMSLAVAAVDAQGRLDRPVQFVHEHGPGLPGGTAHAVEQAYKRLVDQGVLMVVGPAIGDNAIVITELADAHRTPTINWSASERARSEYMFHLQVGSHEDESILLARHVAAAGITRVAIVFDYSPIGVRHVAFFEQECALVGVRVGSRVSVPPLALDVRDALDAVRNPGIEGLVYLGLGWAGRELARATTRAGWQVPCFMNAAGMRGADPDFAKDIDGWVYPDMHSDHNQVLAAARDRCADPSRFGAALAFGYDMGQLVAEGLARAEELSREGVKVGLERIKLVPAAEGHDGTVLGFGRWDRGALKGRYLVLRHWRDGTSVEIDQGATS
jgi:branched-chain amino acid transport system substrate-binding protein